MQWGRVGVAALVVVLLYELIATYAAFEQGTGMQRVPQHQLEARRLRKAILADYHRRNGGGGMEPEQAAGADAQVQVPRTLRVVDKEDGGDAINPPPPPPPSQAAEESKPAPAAPAAPAADGDGDGGGDGEAAEPSIPTSAPAGDAASVPRSHKMQTTTVFETPITLSSPVRKPKLTPLVHIYKGPVASDRGAMCHHLRKESTWRFTGLGTMNNMTYLLPVYPQDDPYVLCIAKRIKGRHLDMAQAIDAAWELAEYTKIHAVIMDPTLDVLPRKFIYFTGGRLTNRNDFSFGNKFLAMLTAFNLALVTRRAFFFQMCCKPGHEPELESEFFLDDPEIDWSMNKHVREGYEGLPWSGNPDYQHCAKAKNRKKHGCKMVNLGHRYSKGKNPKTPGNLHDVAMQEGDLNEIWTEETVQVNAWSFFGAWLYSNPRYVGFLRAFDSDYGGLQARFLFQPHMVIREQMDAVKTKHFGTYNVAFHARKQSSTGGTHFTVAKAPVACVSKLLKEAAGAPSKHAVFVAGQHTSIGAQLKESFAPSPTITDDWQTKFGWGDHHKVGRGRLALFDMFMLAEGDALVVTDVSTFSVFSEIYGGVTTYSDKCDKHLNSQNIELCFMYNKQHCPWYQLRFRWRVPRYMPPHIYGCPPYPKWQFKVRCSDHKGQTDPVHKPGPGVWSG